MKIRSITLFTHLKRPPASPEIDKLRQAANAARTAYEAAGFEVQTVRLATDFLSHIEVDADPLATVIALEAQCQEAGFEFVSLGPANDAALPLLPDILSGTDSIFTTCHIVPPKSRTIDGDRVHQAARVIKAAAAIDDGFGNLRFAALANVSPGTPFFPAAYWTDDQPAFAIATQSADLALVAATQAHTGVEAHKSLRTTITQHGKRIDEVAREISEAHHLRFLGTDFSLAPYPGSEDSIGGALEALTGQPLGEPGTLAAAATLTSAIQEADFQHTGFCGLMMPVLEDSVLAQRAAEGRLRIPELLQWSAVCGTGLDTVPIPGDASEAAIAGTLFDVAALAVRLDKPLTARLMPLPGKVAGDPVHFDFAYFADGGVLPLGRGRTNRLASATKLSLAPYASSQD